jgi:S-adenosylmethionine/arginine decarboxylase-like enzyme
MTFSLKKYKHLVTQFTGCYGLTDKGEPIIASAVEMDKMPLKDLGLNSKSAFYQFKYREDIVDLRFPGKREVLIKDLLQEWVGSRRNYNAEVLTKNERLETIIDKKIIGKDLGRHWIAIFDGIKNLPNAKETEGYFDECKDIVGASRLHYLGKDFNTPNGGEVLGIYGISESHFALETDASIRRAAYSFYTCNSDMPGMDTVEFMRKKLRGSKSQVVELKRYSEGICLAS